jgi:hypothetical protein
MVKHVIEEARDDPSMEQAEPLLNAMRDALGGPIETSLNPSVVHAGLCLRQRDGAGSG